MSFVCLYMQTKKRGERRERREMDVYILMLARHDHRIPIPLPTDLYEPVNLGQ